MTYTYVPIALLSIEREAAACMKYLPLAMVLLCKARLLGQVGLLRPWLASRKLRAPLHTQRRVSGPSARDPGPYTPDKSSYPCHLLRSDQPRGRKISRTCSLFPWLPIQSDSNSRTVRSSTSTIYWNGSQDRLGPDITMVSG